jgi:hypothetical protein
MGITMLSTQLEIRGCIVNAANCGVVGVWKIPDVGQASTLAVQGPCLPDRSATASPPRSPSCLVNSRCMSLLTSTFRRLQSLLLILEGCTFSVNEAATRTCRLHRQTSWHGGGTGASTTRCENVLWVPHLYQSNVRTSQVISVMRSS